MITRPFDLESRLSPPPRDFTAIAWVNVGVIALFFTLLGSRFVLAPGLLVDLATLDPAAVSSAAAEVVITYRRDNLILLNDGKYTLTELRPHLERAARKHPGTDLLVRVDKQVSAQAWADLGAMAAAVGFKHMILAGDKAPADLQK